MALALVENLPHAAAPCHLFNHGGRGMVLLVEQLLML
jgi:hypothetical protein